ncbi:lysine/arginine permease [Candida albicans P60002]|uniref:Probable lysine/arginine permease CAN3 n=2 Tax=Candida albicans TaxID=5476 RepID=CAN3_CANAL|nr:Can3p [Candida albicans SC5314]A0A1D8PPG4.1 RecName: Full=Probable lysine/arginine permease CAN3; AltName: Full=Basic amino acids permease CAN3 [Candida albicans SC5314]KAF6071020.1 Lysine/arginine permease CAN1 [Candida albicans]KGQ85965.1 lysine/arginine permease [Candida albicans P37005]KGT65958.1 lysine/arginine permease [Candida albicans 12C]KGU05381.1 lysine/arginine permease [Candida albicans 19F]KGU24977.1 lysine/arginine permease [Candida albicans P75063]KHC47598.1 lysine/arginin|eukprot:XP_019330993.1 Can3p [Candida albicans SC5314]
MVLLKEKPRTIGTDSDNSIYKDIEQSITPPSDKNEIFIDQINNDRITEYDSHGEVKRDLKARHVAMIGIGSTIGTGLFISTGHLLSQTGPVMSLISFLFVTTICFSVTQSLGEMATYIPVSGSFVQFITRWVSKSCGAANGWLYGWSWAITFGLELSIVGQVIQFWTDAIPLAAWISIFFVLLTALNLFPVKFYGEIEFWMASIKLTAVIGWIIYAFCMVCGAGKTGPVGFRYWRNGYAWGDGMIVSNNGKYAIAFINGLINAVFTFQGTELVAITAGEASPKALKSAIRKVMFRILVFYVLCMLFIGLLVPYNDPKLTEDGGFTRNSPFLIAMENSGTKVLPHIFNAVIVTTIISAGNSTVYAGSRIFYGLAESGVAPKIFLSTTKAGVPYVAVLFTAAFGALGYLVVSNDGTVVFNWLLNIAATAGLVAWGFISVSHIRFMQVLKQRGISRDTLPFKAFFMPYSAYYAAIVVFTVALIQGFTVFWDFNATDFFTAYVSLIVFVVWWIMFHFFFFGFGKQAWKWSNVLIPLEECDIDTGVRDINDIEFDVPPPKNLWQKFWLIIA